MDKQIIIGGVDVKKCVYHESGYCTISKEAYCYCCDKPNCHYKNWQHKEQECEELKIYIESNEQQVKEVETLVMDNDRLINELDQLKAENEILKEKFEIAIKNNMDKTLLRLEKGDVQEELQEIREQFGIETLYCHVDNTRVHRCLDVLRLKDTLAEIKEIAEAHKKDESVWNPYRQLDKILQKISEVE